MVALGGGVDSYERGTSVHVFYGRKVLATGHVRERRDATVVVSVIEVDTRYTWPIGVTQNAPPRTLP